MSEGAAEGLILCGDMEGVAQYSQSHISKFNSRWTALDRVLWVRCGWWQTGSQWDSWHSLTSKSGCIMVQDEVGPGWGFAYRGLSVPLTTSDAFVHMALWCGLVNDHLLLCFCVCWVIFPQISLGGTMQVYFLTLSTCCNPFSAFMNLMLSKQYS